MDSLPFARLNLRRNPFGEPSVEDLGALFVGGLEDWPSYLRADTVGEGANSPRCLQLLGPPGCGKTTTLLALRERFSGSALVAWCPVHGCPAIQGSRTGPLFVDDAQMMSGPHLSRVLRSPVVAVATQKDLGVSFHEAGFCIKTVPVSDRVNLHCLQEMVGRRLEWARRGPGPLPEVEEGALQGLLRRHGRNLMAIQAELYDWYQQLEDEE
jgi:DNA polymerase III delta prime subunit